MPDANNNKLHLMYLPLLADLSSVSSYSWGSAVLAVLYRELCWVTNSDVVDMGGCLTLLQSWVLYRMPFLASVSHHPYVYPLVNRWSVRSGIRKSHTVPIYRLMIEQYTRKEFIWMPYHRPEITDAVPSSAYVHSHIWCTNAPIIIFNMVEWYHGDRVLRQFGCIQPIPDPPCEGANTPTSLNSLDPTIPQYGMHGPSDPYPHHHGTPSGSSSSVPNEPQDFLSPFATPPPAPNDDVGRRPERDH
ncbi:serine/threonine-protein phosphatase 7 long form homolog [Gossypium hirsutum]|uniref:Serine/threonine-protein phosphatase 7 long form homolog n=1 Tax=Gossypium hirsutum TaxID=3635 RepID=A0A1U8KC05_GOSHI|nr:serine/threonine-protein phosphatase 7 long form homolog [Gossypium hirsutum]